MAVITVNHKGDFKHIDGFFKRMKEKRLESKLLEYAQKGVSALSSATPIDTGTTASSWNYEIENTAGGISINWINTNVNKHVNIAIILQTGHGTRNGGYVQGRDYINPAIQPIFDQMANEAWREVTE